MNAILSDHHLKLNLGTVPDTLAMAVAIRPEIVLKSLTCPVIIELGGQVTRGQMVKRVMNTERLPRGPQVEVVICCDNNIFKQLFGDILERS